MLKQGSAYVAGTLAEIGEIPWSVFEAAPSFLERDDGKIQKASSWL